MMLRQTSLRGIVKDDLFEDCFILVSATLATHYIVAIAAKKSLKPSNGMALILPKPMFNESGVRVR